MIPHKIIENFLPKNDFKYLQDLIVWNAGWPWYLADPVAGLPNAVGYDESHWMFQHTVYQHCVPVSDFFENLRPLYSRLPDIKGLLRVKCNFYPQTSKVLDHGEHRDYEIPNFDNKGAILYLNTCDGYTKFHDGTKIENVENRLLLFDPQILHSSSTTSNAKGRFNININYL